MYQSMFAQMRKQLGQIGRWLDVAVTHAEARKFDPELYLGLRLAPDQFAFARQIQISCDTAKLGASRLTGKPAPSQADDERTLADLRARVAAVITYLEGFTSDDFAGCATAVVTQPRWEGKTMTGADYFVEHVVPNFNFHLTTAYAILRHNGVPVGKRDYLGALTQKLP